MDITQPEAEVTSEKIQAEEAKLTQIRNKATLLEGEISRLRDVRNSEEYTIGELVKRKAELTNDLSQLEKDVKKLHEQKITLESDTRSLEMQNIQMQSQVAIQGQNLSQRTVELQEREKTHAVASEEVKKARAELDAKITTYEEEKRKLKEKEQKLKEIIN